MQRRVTNRRTIDDWTLKQNSCSKTDVRWISLTRKRAEEASRENQEIIRVWISKET